MAVRQKDTAEGGGVEATRHSLEEAREAAREVRLLHEEIRSLRDEAVKLREETRLAAEAVRALARSAAPAAAAAPERPSVLAGGGRDPQARSVEDLLQALHRDGALGGR